MCPCTTVRHSHPMVVEATVDFPNCFHHFLKLSHLRNVALDPLDFGDRHQIYVYRLLHSSQWREIKKKRTETKWKQKHKDINVTEIKLVS